MVPIIGATIPNPIPASMDIDNAGLWIISPIIVFPAGVELYNVLVNDVPKKNKTGIAMINKRDHFPKLVLGNILTFILLFYS